MSCELVYVKLTYSIAWLSLLRLGGYEPFAPEDDANDSLIYERIIKCDYKFEDEFWETVSLSAKDFISKLLVADTTKRMTAKDGLEHPWVKVHYNL